MMISPISAAPREAHQHFTDWRDTLERRVRGCDLPDALTSHLAKYRGLIPRLALVTHLIDEGERSGGGNVPY